MNVTVNAASGDNTLYLWMPHVIETPEQTHVQLVAQDPDPIVDRTTARPCTRCPTSRRAASTTSALSWMFDRYAVETQVNPSRIPASYDTTTDMYRHFTSPDALAPAASPEVVKAAAGIVGGEKNPWYKARRLYEWMVSTLSFAQTTQEGDPLALLKTKKGDAFAWSSLYCALLRSVGVPSRMVAGYLAGDPGNPARRHFWDEFYIESLGWVPVDPLLADAIPRGEHAGPGRELRFSDVLLREPRQPARHSHQGAGSGEPDGPAGEDAAGQGAAIPAHHPRRGRWKHLPRI